MYDQTRAVCEPLVAFRAGKRFLPGMNALVPIKVTTAWKAFSAFRTRKRSLSSVAAVGEAFVAVFGRRNPLSSIVNFFMVTKMPFPAEAFAANRTHKGLGLPVNFFMLLKGGAVDERQSAF